MGTVDWRQTVRSIWVCPNHLGSILCSGLESGALSYTPQARKWKQRLEIRGSNDSDQRELLWGQEGTGRKTFFPL